MIHNVRRATLIYNPASGGSRERRVEKVQAAAQVFRQAGVEVQLVATTLAGSAITQAREAATSGCEAVIACGGDGTINEVAQGLVEGGTDSALGMIPLGTANALATHLGLPWDAVAAAQALLRAEKRRVAIGKMEFQDREGKQASRYWLAAASVGVDAELMYIISTLHKGRFGMAAYFAGGARVLFRYHFAPFAVEFTESETGRKRQEIVTHFLAARVANFGKLFKRVAPGAGLTRDDASLILFKTRSLLTYIRFVAAVLSGVGWRIPGIEIVRVSELRASQILSPEMLAPEWRAHSQERSILRAEVDGEVVGTLPARITIVPNALSMLLPRMAN